MDILVLQFNIIESWNQPLNIRSSGVPNCQNQFLIESPESMAVYCYWKLTFDLRNHDCLIVARSDFLCLFK